MKKLLIILVICSFLQSCNNSDKFVGKWQAQSEVNGLNILNLYENGDYTWYVENAIKSFKKGKWKVKGDSLYMNNYEINIEEMILSYYIIRINDHQMIIKTPFADWAADIYEFKKEKW